MLEIVTSKLVNAKGEQTCYYLEDQWLKTIYIINEPRKGVFILKDLVMTDVTTIKIMLRYSFNMKENIKIDDREFKHEEYSYVFNK